MIQAVLDTNVIVSAHLKGEGREALILELALAGYFRWYVSEELMEEYEEVLRRPRFALEPGRIRRWTRELRKRVRMVNPGKAVKVTKDPDDNKVLECALEARADYVVTENVRHFPARYQDIRVVTPREFMKILAADPSKI